MTEKFKDIVVMNHESLTLTNKRLIQEYVDWGYKEYTEIPLNKIDSIKYKNVLNFSMLILGCIIFIIGVILQFTEYVTYGWIGLAVGAIIIGLVFFLRRENIIFESASASIEEDSKDVEEFVDAVRKQIYKQ